MVRWSNGVAKMLQSIKLYYLNLSRMYNSGQLFRFFHEKLNNVACHLSIKTQLELKLTKRLCLCKIINSCELFEEEEKNAIAF